MCTCWIECVSQTRINRPRQPSVTVFNQEKTVATSPGTKVAFQPPLLLKLEASFSATLSESCFSASATRQKVAFQPLTLSKSIFARSATDNSFQLCHCLTKSVQSLPTSKIAAFLSLTRFLRAFFQSQPLFKKYL